MKRVDPEMTRRARALRTSATRAERTMWRLLSRYRPKFTRQLVEGPFILDLACRASSATFSRRAAGPRGKSFPLYFDFQTAGRGTHDLRATTSMFRSPCVATQGDGGDEKSL